MSFSRVNPPISDQSLFLSIPHTNTGVLSDSCCRYHQAWEDRHKPGTEQMRRGHTGSGAGGDGAAAAAAAAD